MSSNRLGPGGEAPVAMAFVKVKRGKVHIATEPDPDRWPSHVQSLSPEARRTWAFIMAAVWTRCGLVLRGIGPDGATGVSRFPDEALCGACHRTLRTAEEVEAAFSTDRAPDGPL